MLFYQSETTQTLYEERSKFEAIFYGSESHMVIFQGPEMVIEMFNKKYQDIYPKRDLLGKKLLDVVPELQSTKFPLILKNVYETGESFVSQEGLVNIMNFETNILEERYFDTTFSRISYGEDRPYRILATPREVTDRVFSKRLLEENLRELERERDLRERFVASLSHDLRNPLAIAKMAASYLKNELGDQDDTHSMLDKITQSLDRADRMIYNLLDANRIKVGLGIPVVLDECRLDLIIKNVADELSEIHGPRFNVEDVEIEVSGNWDQLAIHRMIENIAVNAIKYGSYDTKISFSLVLQGSHVEVAIHNHGEPISPDELKNLFSSYNRTKAAIQSGKTGWGIGLASVKAIVESHRGSVSVTSNETQGTTFFIRLPL